MAARWPHNFEAKDGLRMPHGMAPLEGVHRIPRVWLLTGQKAGDNSQVTALAEALGWPFETKRFAYNRLEPLAHACIGATMAGVDRRASSPLAPPWPDLVLTAGRRNEPIARWIKKQAGAHPVRVVHVGRPWSNLDHFDLVVTTPQYRLPVRPNVLHNETPLHRVTKARVAEASARWRSRLAHLPAPHVAVVIGGSSGPYSFDHRAGERLARQASALARSLGGSLVVTTSARTPADVMETFENHLSVPAFLYRWRKDDDDNPYFAFLGLAHSIVVTGDSMSMLTEACFTRKPVYIFDLGEGRNAMRMDPPPARGAGSGYGLQPTHVKAFLYRQLMRYGPVRLSRDIRIIHRDLVAAGRAAWLGDAFDVSVPPPLACLSRAVGAVRALFSLPPSPARDAEEPWAEALQAREAPKARRIVRTGS
jgi:mitochondrial fission protein ELM1